MRKVIAKYCEQIYKIDEDDLFLFYMYHTFPMRKVFKNDLFYLDNTFSKK